MLPSCAIAVPSARPHSEGNTEGAFQSLGMWEVGLGVSSWDPLLSSLGPLRPTCPLTNMSVSGLVL